MHERGPDENAPARSAEPTTCPDTTHRTVRLFLSYADANTARVSFKAALEGSATTPHGLMVSPLRPIERGWSFTICARCVEDRADGRDGRPV